jgi:hypothetical protein
MKKKLASLTAAFTLAVSGLVAPAAQAQTVPVYGTGTYNTYSHPASNYVSQRDISTVANALGVMTVYPGAGKGFSSGILHRTGQHIGLEYDLHGNGMASVVRAYNLDNPQAMRQYRAAMGEALQLDNAMNGRLHNVRRPVQPQYRPTVPDVLVGVGLLYILHEAIDNKHDRHHHHYTPPRNHRHDRYDRHPPRHHNHRR